MNNVLELIVSPYSTCYMVNATTNTLLWSLPKMDDIELYQLLGSVHNEHVDVVEDDGKLTVCHMSRNFREPRVSYFKNQTFPICVVSILVKNPLMLTFIYIFFMYLIYVCFNQYFCLRSYLMIKSNGILKDILMNAKPRSRIIIP
jgi:hypothetical protein